MAAGALIVTGTQVHVELLSEYQQVTNQSQPSRLMEHPHGLQDRGLWFMSIFHLHGRGCTDRRYLDPSVLLRADVPCAGLQQGVVPWRRSGSWGFGSQRPNTSPCTQVCELLPGAEFLFVGVWFVLLRVLGCVCV